MEAENLLTAAAHSIGVGIDPVETDSGDARRPLRRWLDRLLPAVCLVCGDPLQRGSDRVCGLCWAQAPRPRAPLCDRCGISLQDSGARPSRTNCIECVEWLPYLRCARAPYVMRGTAAAMVHAFKYGGWRGLAPEMGAVMAEVRFEAALERQLGAVVAVPLSAARLRERGFNQAELLARSVAELRDLPFLADALVRVRHTRRQARLSPRERQANVAGAFRVPDGGSGVLDDAHLLLVDDVLTTAATVQDCVRALCRAGARAVSVLTFARARPELPRETVRAPGQLLRHENPGFARRARALSNRRPSP